MSNVSPSMCSHEFSNYQVFHHSTESTRNSVAVSAYSVRVDIERLSMDIKLLLVEDDQDLREIVTESLTGWHHPKIALRVECAKDGLEALEMIHGKPYDLIITDMKMPRLNGKQLIEAIKENAGPNSDTPCIITSGAEEFYLDELDKGLFEKIVVMSKPLDFSSLIRQVQFMVYEKFKRDLNAT